MPTTMSAAAPPPAAALPLVLLNRPFEESIHAEFIPRFAAAELRAVETQGRERVVALLGSMGVDKASQLPESRWPELMKALNA